MHSSFRAQRHSRHAPSVATTSATINSRSKSSPRLPTRGLDSKFTFPPDSARNTPRFSRLLSSVLSPSFALNLYDDNRDMVDGSFASVPGDLAVTRPPSPVPSMDFSLISPPSPTETLMPSPNDDIIVDIFSGVDAATCSFFVNSPRRADLYKSPKPTKGLFPRLWDVLSSPSKRHRNLNKYWDYDGLPLDGEEGELIDDEACFINATEPTRIDIVSRLPSELGLYLLLFLDLPSILACHTVSKQWHSLASDSDVWRELFYRQPGWKIDPVAVRRKLRNSTQLPTVTVNDRVSQVLEEWSRSKRRMNSLLPNVAPVASTYSTDTQTAQAHNLQLAPLSLDWRELYRNRHELDRRWKTAQPKPARISGHEDSVYCLEFDSQTIITGSRDKTIKIWSLRSGKLQATLRGHTGSVLCLKFDKTGFMVSGSSDCTIFVWDLNALTVNARQSSTSGSGGAATPSGSLELVQRVLKGHSGGVLDLRIDKNWIVSCSKDALIRVWCRKTLTLFTTLRGHEGPVNAVGLQDGRVVSASGDGKMMLWDIATTTRIRTFEGHDRGLACIEFKDDFIVSGSNDCKIKIWSASTGECLRTLTGHDLLVRALSFDPSTGRLVSASYDRTIKVWDFASGKMLREFKNCHSSHIFDVKFDACRIVSTSHDQKIAILDFSQDLDTSLFV